MPLAIQLIVLALDLFIIVVCVLLILFGLSISQTTNRSAPFVPTSSSFVSEIIKVLNLSESSRLYEIGAGDARVLLACHDVKPRATYVGIEKSLFPYLLGRLNIARHRAGGRVTLLKKNAFDVDFSSATHVYTYLLPQFMDSLLPKLERELPPGAVLVSQQFPFSDKSPASVLSYPHRLAWENPRILYIYIF